MCFKFVYTYFIYKSNNINNIRSNIRILFFRIRMLYYSVLLQGTNLVHQGYMYVPYKGITCIDRFVWLQQTGSVYRLGM